MNHDDADRLARQLRNAFGRGPTADLIASELLEMDYARAFVAINKLVRESEHAPSIAVLWATYRAQLGTAKGEPCELCSDTGWITDLDHPAHWPGDPVTLPVVIDSNGHPDPTECACNVVTTCGCTAGRKARTPRKENAA